MYQMFQRLSKLTPVTLTQRLSAVKTAENDWSFGKSEISGTGVFADRDFQPGELIDVAMFASDKDEWGNQIWNLTLLSRYCNHSPENNARIERSGDQFDLIATKPIPADSEITADYRQVTRAVGPDGRMQFEGQDVPTSDLSDYT